MMGIDVYIEFIGCLSLATLHVPGHQFECQTDWLRWTHGEKLWPTEKNSGRARQCIEFVGGETIWPYYFYKLVLVVSSIKCPGF